MDIFVLFMYFPHVLCTVSYSILRFHSPSIGFIDVPLHDDGLGNTPFLYCERLQLVVMISLSSIHVLYIHKNYGQ